MAKRAKRIKMAAVLEAAIEHIEQTPIAELEAFEAELASEDASDLYSSFADELKADADEQRYEEMTDEELSVELDAAAYDAPAEDDTSELEGVISTIEAQKEVSAIEAPAEEVVADVAMQEADLRPFNEVLEEITNEAADEFAVDLVKSLESRQAFEKLKDVGNGNIQKTIDGARKSLVVSRNYPRVMIACNTDVDFANKMIHDGSRYNVYAIQKLADIVKGLSGVSVMTNKINRSVIASMLAIVTAGKTFDMNTAKAAASDKWTDFDVALKPLFKQYRHTVSSGTAPTQASSTMQALQTLGLVNATGSKKNPIYAFTDTPAAVKLKELFAPAV